MELIGLALCAIGLGFCIVYIIAVGLDKLADMIAKDFKDR